MKNTIAIVGAGISGLLVARVLADRGARLIVLEKSRGVGGRMATKRVGDAVFDQGAQFFTVREPALAAQVQAWEEAGVIGRWPGTPHRRWIGRSGMTAVAKNLSQGLEIEKGHRVTAARSHGCGCWELDLEDRGMLRAERLVLTAPLPQALAILDQGGVTLPPEVDAGLRGITYDPCLALLLVLDGPSEVPEGGLEIAEGPFRWVADNVRKGISPQVAAALTLHASADFSAEHYGLPEAEVTQRLVAAAAPWIGGRRVVSSTLHRWRYSEPRAKHPEPCVWLPDLRLGFAGDAFGGGRVEGAALSGLALAQRILPCLQP